MTLMHSYIVVITFLTQSAPDQSIRQFETKIRPVLVSKCLSCHSSVSGKMKGNLDLATAEGLKRGGDRGPSVVPGKPEESQLLQALRYSHDDLKMPPAGPLAADIVREFEVWIRQGAIDPRSGSPASPGKKPAPVFWSITPLVSPKIPVTADSAWPQSDLDRFVRATQEAAGVHPVADARPEQLFRRLYLDLTGLPPSREEVVAFLKDPSEQAYGATVNRLLASPHFGETWGRHWLDVARFGESTGKQVNFSYPHAWRYRNWVVDAFNSDMPLADFITRQLAGDLLPATSETAKDANRIATGFLAVGAKALNERNATQFAMDMADEQLDATTQAFLGLTVACARCHDHKYDPVSQSEYTAMAGIFRSTDTCYGTIRLVQAQHPSRLITLSGKAPAGREARSAEELKTLTARRDRLNSELEALRSSDPMAAFVSMQGVRLRIQQGMVQGQLELYDSKGEPKRLAMGAKDRFFATDVPIYERGEVDHPGATVPRGLPTQLGGTPKAVKKGSGRLELAQWIATHPLAARVAVNRVWLHLMGHGLVPSSDNFGLAGTPPRDQRLLDWLASGFIASGGSTKQLIQKIVMSRTYRLGNETHPAAFEKDPDNTTWWKHERRRLDAETLRDSLLAVSGRLDHEPLQGTQLAQANEGFAVGPQGGGEISSTKRSIYLPVLRDGIPEALALFDGADPSLIVPERHATSTPAQGLFLLNNPEMIRSAEALARMILDKQEPDNERMDRLAHIIWSRPARPAEIETGLAFVEAFVKKRGGLPARARFEAWSALAHAQLASADFLLTP